MTRMSQRRYAARIGVSHVYINRLVHEGKLPTDAKRKIDPDEADAILAAMREPARPQRRAGGGKADKPKAVPTASMPQRDVTGSPHPGSGDLPTMLLKTRIKSEVGRANLLDLKSKVEAGKYVDADEVRAAAFNRGRAVRDNLLNIAGRLAAVTAAESDERKCFELIDAEIKAALEVLTKDIGDG